MIETVPLKLTMRHTETSVALSAEVERGTKRLAELEARIVRCDVLVEPPGPHHRHGSNWRVRIDVTIPGKDVVVDHTRATDPIFAVHQAFAAAARRIERFRRRHVARRAHTHQA